jgi:hypothetical protein
MASTAEHVVPTESPSASVGANETGEKPCEAAAQSSTDDNATKSVGLPAAEVGMETNAASEDTVARDDDEVAADAPSSSLLLTKAKLFTVASEDGSWTEIGVGTVAIRLDATTGDDSSDDSDDDPPGARMDVVSIEEEKEVLMSTPLVEDDIYVVQHGTILVWSDPEIGRDMALSFNTPEGCKLTTDAIVKYQSQCRELKRKAEREAASGGAASTTAASESDAGRQDTTPNAMRQVSGVSSEGAEDHASPWSVTRANLTGIALALQNNVRRFALHLRETDKFAASIAALFRACVQDDDINSANIIGRIVVGLLGPPFNTDGRILSQFIDNDVIDHTLDIVQHALGRRTVESGFVDAATRRAKFRNPCNLPAAVVTKIHVLYAAQSLKDLVPLLLDEGDAAGNSLLAVFLLRFKFGLVNDILRHDTCLPNAFVCPETHADLGTMRTFIAFLHDVSKTIKNAMVPFDAKESLYEEMFSCGVLEYARRALSVLTSIPPQEDRNELQEPDDAHLPHSIVSMLCDVVAHMVMFYTKVRDTMLEDANTPMPAAAADAASTVAMRRCLWQRANFSVNTVAASGAAAQQPTSAIFTALMAHDRHSKCFLDVMMDAAVWASSSGVSMVAQSAYDLVYSCSVGLLQGNVYAAVGHNIQPRRRQLVKYLVEGNDHKAPTSPTAVNGNTHSVTVLQPFSALVSRHASDESKHEGEVPSEEVSGECTAVQAASSATLEVLDPLQQCDNPAESFLAPPLHSDWPPLYRLLYAIGNLSTAAATAPEAPPPVPWTSHAAHRLSLHYLVRLVMALTKDPIIGQSLGFPVMIEASHALRTVRSMLTTTVRLQGGAPSPQHGSIATVQASCIAWIAELVAPGDATINQVLVASGVLLPVVDLFVALHGRRRGGGSILGSAAAHALDNVHQSIHRRKGTLNTASNSPLTNHSFTSSPSQAAAGTTNPFLRSIGKDGLDSSRTRSLAGDSSTLQALNSIDVTLVQQILQQRGDALKQSVYDAHRHLAASLERVIEETPEEASEELSSREASSVAVAAAVMSDLDFNALLAEYGPDAPVSDTMLRDVVGEDVAHNHSHHATSSDDDDETSPSGHLPANTAEAEDNGDASVDGNVEERVGFLLRRESTIRRKRSRTPPPRASESTEDEATDSIPPLSDDDEDDQLSSSREASGPTSSVVDQPPMKQARAE